jgi:DNA-binding transcriptional regulator YhcF (GntR family)
MKRQLTIRIDLNSDIPASRQIVGALRALLVDGELQPGDLLPSVRRLALDLNVHFNTVAQAYRELAEEGWLDLQHGRRAMVRTRMMPPNTGQVSQRGFQKRLREMVAEMRAEGLPTGAIVAELLTLAERLKS